MSILANGDYGAVTAVAVFCLIGVGLVAVILASRDKRK